MSAANDEPIIHTDPRGCVWEIEYHRFAGWRGIRNNAATDDDVTDYSNSIEDVLEALQ